MYIICGLGNPGKEYALTRHNMGFQTIDILSDRLKCNVDQIKFKALIGETRVNGEKVILVKPQTFMNNSGEALRPIMDFYKVPLENILVIYDDSDVEVGNIRLRAFGSAGSHNGMKSAVLHLGSEKFPRLRIGIGAKPTDDMVDFVIGKPLKSEQPLIKEAQEKAADAVLVYIENGIDMAMNKFNIKKQKEIK